MKATHMNHPRNGQLLLALLITAAVALYCMGCKSTSAKYDATTGNWSVSDRRLFLRTEAEVDASIQTSGTRTLTIKAKSDPQTDAFKAIAEGAAAGAAKFIP